MPPKKTAARDDDGEEQSGMCCPNATVSEPLQLTIAPQVRFTPSLGMKLHTPSSICNTNSGRPVVVAENMIGVAMYELVGFQYWAHTWQS